MILLVTNLDGVHSECTMASALHPSRWSADNARAFLHDVMRAIGAHGVYRVSFDPGAPGPLCVLTVEADTGTGTITLPGLSTAGRVELERRAFELPWHRP